jgi:hypothetical protein
VTSLREESYLVRGVLIIEGVERAVDQCDESGLTLLSLGMGR